MTFQLLFGRFEDMHNLMTKKKKLTIVNGMVEINSKNWTPFSGLISLEYLKFIYCFHFAELVV